MYSYTDLQDTIVALSTPPGIGAIGMIRLSGPKSISICDLVFKGVKGKQLAEQKSHTLHFGRIKDGEKVLDEVVVGLFKGPNSYTKEDVIEVSCHGSPYILQAVLQLFIKMGARLAKPGEFTMRAFLNGRMDLSQAEAVADLIAAESESAHQTAMNQMRGGYSLQIAALRQELLDFASLIELELDFSEEDVEFAQRAELVALVQRIQHLLQELIQSFQLGNVIKNGVTTVIAGRPNAGKSTLLNALLNEERAIVSEIAGTTRDVIEVNLNIDGILFRLIDTAGIRDATNKIEAIGVEKTFEKIAQSSLLVYVFGVDELSFEEAVEDVKRLRKEDFPILILANKIDMSSEQDFKVLLKEHFPNETALAISAKENQEISQVKQVLRQKVIAGEIATDGSLVTNVRHAEVMQKAESALQTVLEGIEMQLSGELLAMDIRAALQYLGEITGSVTTEDLLGNIFGRFCIGK